MKQWGQGLGTVTLASLSSSEHFGDGGTWRNTLASIFTSKMGDTRAELPCAMRTVVDAPGGVAQHLHLPCRPLRDVGAAPPLLVSCGSRDNTSKTSSLHLDV